MKFTEEYFQNLANQGSDYVVTMSLITDSGTFIYHVDITKMDRTTVDGSMMFDAVLEALNSPRKEGFAKGGSLEDFAKDVYVKTPCHVMGTIEVIYG